MRSALILIGAIGVAACSDDSKAPTPTPDKGVVADTGTKGDTGAKGDTGSKPDTGAKGDASGACSNVTQLGQPVKTQHSNQTMPTPAGGTIVPGTYTRTAETIYDGTTGTGSDIDRETWRLTAGASTDSFKLEAAYQENDTAPVIGSGTFAISGGKPTMTITCPAGMAPQNWDGYTASATELKLFHNGNKRVRTFAKQ